MSNKIIAVLLGLVCASALGQGVRVETTNNVSTTRMVAPAKALDVGQTYILRPKPGRALAKGALQVQGHIWADEIGVGIARGVTEAQRRLLERDWVLIPDRTVTVQTVPNDPTFPNQWDLTKISMPAAWDVSTGSQEIIVAVVDTGIWADHPDLRDNMWTAPDGSHGWACFSGIITPNYTDDMGHGTHCAGTIGAVGNNALGVAGVNWRVRLKSYKFLGASGSGQLSDAILLYNQMAKDIKSGQNIRVASNSWGGVSEPDQAMIDAFMAVENLGVLTVCAAGNNGLNIDLTPFTPASLATPGNITVMATDATTRAGFSNFGLVAVDVAAPGVDIWSTLPTDPNCKLRNDSGYGQLNGTSMACPHVAGLAALALSVNPSLTVLQLRTLLLNHDSLDSMPDLALILGTSGQINASKTLHSQLVISPRVNTPPRIDSIPSQTVPAGQPATFSIHATDAEGPVRYAIIDYSNVVPPVTTNTITFTPPHLPFDMCMPFVAAAVDMDGGSASSQFYCNVLTDPSWPYNDYTLSSGVTTERRTSGDPFWWWFLQFDTKAPVWTHPNVAIGFDCVWSESGGIGRGSRFFVPSTPAFSMAGTNRYRAVWVEGLDMEKHARRSPKVYLLDDQLLTNNVVGFPDIRVVVDKVVGVAPLTVNIDLTGSVAPNGIKYANVYESSSSFSPYTNVVSTYTFTMPGTKVLRCLIWDNQGYGDYLDTIISVLAPTGPAPVAPTFVTQPSDQSLKAGEIILLTAQATGTAPITYQWCKGTDPLAGATGTNYTKTAVLGDTGAYCLVASNAGGSATSLVAQVTVRSAPVITTQPVGQAVDVGDAFSLSLSATGTVPFLYQWWRDGVRLYAATSALYSVASATLADAGSYVCSVSNVVGGVVSTPAVVTVATSPPIQDLVPIIALSSSSYDVKALASYSVRVTANGSPVPMVTLTATLRTANGRMVTKTLYTGTAGTSTGWWQLGPKYGTGTYTMTVVATKQGFASGSDVKSFNVHK